MSKPKFKYEIQREDSAGTFRVSTTSFPQFQEDLESLTDDLGYDTGSEETIVIRKVKNND